MWDVLTDAHVLTHARLVTCANTQGLIATVNAANAGWKAGRNERFEGMTLEEVKHMMGTHTKASGKAKPALANEGSPAPITHAAPVSFDARTAWPNCTAVSGKIYDQSDCGEAAADGGLLLFRESGPPPPPAVSAS